MEIKSDCCTCVYELKIIQINKMHYTSYYYAQQIYVKENCNLNLTGIPNPIIPINFNARHFIIVFNTPELTNQHSIYIYVMRIENFRKKKKISHTARSAFPSG